MTTLGILLLCAAVGLIVARTRRVQLAGTTTGPALAAEVVIPVLLLGVVFAFYETVLLNVRWGWSACRLAPTIGLFHGYPLYSAADAGPINGWLYGPVAAVAWMPAALADSPLPALQIAATINLVFMLGPLLVTSVRFTPGTGLARLVGFAFGAAALLQVYPTWYMASALNVDAIAVGLGAAAILAIVGDEPRRAWREPLAALLCALAAWTKQTEISVVLALAAWLWVSRGRRSAGRFAVYFAASMVIVAALIAILADPGAAWLNMWRIPSAHPLAGGWQAAGIELVELARYSLVFSVPCVVGLLVSARGKDGEAAAVQRRSALVLPLLAAAAVLPLSVMATIKLGGDRNSMHPVYYLAVGATMAIGRVWAFPPRRPGLIRSLLLLASAAAVVVSVRQVQGYARLTMLPPRCLSQEAWAFAKAHPREMYFPWDPLATLMAEGRMYHFEYGVQDRIYAGLAPEPGHIAAGLPSELKAVVYPRVDGSRAMLRRYLPQYSRLVATEDWMIFRRPEGK